MKFEPPLCLCGSIWLISVVLCGIPAILACFACSALLPVAPADKLRQLAHQIFPAGIDIGQIWCVAF